MGMLQGWQMISRGIPSLTLIGASVNSWTVLGWLMCSTGCRTTGRPVSSVNAFVNQQLLTHIVIHKKEPMQGPLHQHVSVCCCQTVSTGRAFGCQALMPPSQSLFLTVWAETRTRGSRKRSWSWVVAFPRPLHLSWCTCLSTDISSMRLTLCWETQQMACQGHIWPQPSWGGYNTHFNGCLCFSPVCLSHLHNRWWNWQVVKKKALT